MNKVICCAFVWLLFAHVLLLRQPTRGLGCQVGSSYKSIINLPERTSDAVNELFTL
jgi:hypothetical protein